MELRLDGVLYRKEAIQLIKQAVAKAKSGELGCHSGDGLERSF
jgi:hypothetical protein